MQSSEDDLALAKGTEINVHALGTVLWGIYLAIQSKLGLRRHIQAMRMKRQRRDLTLMP